MLLILETWQYFQQSVNWKSGTFGHETKMLPYLYENCHYGDKTVTGSSYLHHGIPYTGKTVSLNWYKPQVPAYHDTLVSYLQVSGNNVHTLRPGSWFNIKILSYQYWKSQCGDKTVIRSSYLHNGSSYTDKAAHIGSAPLVMHICINELVHQWFR